MKKLFKVSTTLLILICCIFGFAACSKQDKSVVLDGEVESISMQIKDFATTYELSGDKLDELAGYLRSQPKMEKTSVDFDLVYNMNSSAHSKLTVVTKKKFLKPSRSYTIGIGRTTVVSRKSDGKVTNTYDDADYISANGYNGTATQELLNFLIKAEEEESKRLADGYYAALIKAFTDKGCTVEHMTERNVANEGYYDKMPPAAVCGMIIRGTLDGESCTIRIFQFKNNTDASSFGKSQSGGGTKYCFWYGGSAPTYAIFDSVFEA